MSKKSKTALYNAYHPYQHPFPKKKTIASNGTKKIFPSQFKAGFP